MGSCINKIILQLIDKCYGTVDIFLFYVYCLLNGGAITVLSYYFPSVRGLFSCHVRLDYKGYLVTDLETVFM